ncbi:MAG: ATP-dependent DNA helicase RecG, partial [Nitrospirae bacterium]|nr:ATP-dependent DNA helicase RecG [Nitrospirota bacterium]
MANNLLEIVEKIRKPLALEQKTGYPDRAAAGGLDRYVQLWVKKGRESCSTRSGRAALKELNDTLAGYRFLPGGEREKRVKKALRIVAGLEKEARVVVHSRPEDEVSSCSGEKWPDWTKESVQYMKGVGPKRAKVLSRLNIETIGDLIYYFPRLYEDRSNLKPINQIQIGKTETIKGKVLAAGIEKPRRRLEILKVAVGDGTGIVYAVWFNQSYLRKSFPVGTTVILSGKVDRFREIQIVNPAYEILAGDEDDLIHTGRLVPLYSLTEKLSQRSLRSLIKDALDKYANRLPDILPEAIRKSHSLIDLPQAVIHIHFPESEEDNEVARRRLVFDEFFFLQLGLALSKQRKVQGKGIKHKVPGKLFEGFRERLPFKLTSAQEKVIEEVKTDMEKEKPMNRLLQGDVGSGKTIVAVFALLTAVEGGFQAALMVPTEILAEQHFLNLQRWFLHLDVKVTLLIGSLSPRMRKESLEEIESGESNIIVGTHALIQEKIKFSRLSLIIIDEQHRFGVRQRAALKEKGLETPDVLIMTATPIPRTLALTVYGDLDVSTIDELPPGRRPVATYWVREKDRQGVYKFLEEEIEKGRQAYIVYPLIEKSEKLEVKAATEMAGHFQRDIFPHLKVGLLHGRMKGEEKEKVMRSFKEGKIDILVSTTVIEVGIDIPNASLMVIEEAGRFGLAQLHQLRGRVGRGDYQSYCLMMGSPASEEGRKRLQVMTETSDGFQIAEEDLE